MGLTVSHAAPAAVTTPLPPIPTGPGSSESPSPASEVKEMESVKWDYRNLPCPVKYEEIQREVMSKLLGSFACVIVAPLVDQEIDF